MKLLIQYKIVISLIAITTASGCSIKDPRLMGTWRSSLELTTEYNEKHAVLTPKQKNFLSQLLGQMEITYISGTKYKIYLPKGIIDTGDKVFDSDESEWTEDYKILHKNKDFVVILTKDSVMGEKVNILNFIDDNTYWVYIHNSSLNIREYFKKLE